MVNTCCIRTCTGRVKGLRVKMHRFPRDLGLRKAWLDRIGNINLYSKKAETLYHNYRVCDMHFSDEDRILAERRGAGIKANAVPNKYLPSPIYYNNPIEIVQVENVAEIETVPENDQKEMSAPEFGTQIQFETNTFSKDIRKDYQSRENALTEESLKFKEPLKLLDQWFELAKNHPNILEPHAVCLATATKDGKPSARFVLCKSHSKEGFAIYTHYTSRKGLELEENPHCALTYYWEPFNRSVRIEGIAEKLPFSAADAYFQKRPYDSKIGALCSNQSQPIENREVLMKKEQELKAKYSKDDDVPRPPQWGGYLIKPHTFEFWQGQTDRLHDRIRFRKLKTGEKIDEKVTHKGDDGWYYERLAP